MSVWGEILAAVKTRVTGLSGLPATPVTREDPRLMQSDTTLPLLAVVDGGPERPIDFAFTKIVWEQYPVLVLWVKVNDRANALVTAELDGRQLIMDTLDQRPPLSGVTAATVTDVDLEPLDLFDYPPNNAVYKVFGVRAIYTAYRTRLNP